MKIACVIHSLDGGGAERVMASLASRLAISGHDVTLITLDDGRISKHDLDARVAVNHLDVMAESKSFLDRIRNTRSRIRRLRQAVLPIHPHVVLSFCDRTNILTLLATRGSDFPVVVSERSDPTQQQLGRVWEWLRDRTYPRAAAMVALTDSAADYLNRRMGRDVTVIPSAVDRPPFQSDRLAAADRCRIVGVGRLEIEKGFDRLIRSFKPLAEAHPNWTLKILGDGSQRGALEQQIETLGLSERVSLPGWVRPVWDELGKATLFVLPSRYEGFPSALLEAMAMGVPSIAVDCESGPRNVIQQDTQGLLVPNEEKALSDAMVHLVADAALREALGNGGRSVIDRFSWDAMMGHYEALLQRVARA